MWSCALALAQPTQLATTQPAQPLSIARQGYFFVGGHLFAVNGDQAMAGQMFVQYQVPAGTIRPYPVVMVHGGGQTGTNFLGTPDGRPGWNEGFLRQGYAVYIIDQPARGRSAYYAAVQGPLALSLAHGTEQRFTAPEKYNLWPQAKLHTQWPGSGKQGDPIFDQFFASQETSIPDNILMDESNRDDLVALPERIGPAIMLTHSRSGPFGWLVADARPDLVRAILAIEPKTTLLRRQYLQRQRRPSYAPGASPMRSCISTRRSSSPRAWHPGWMLPMTGRTWSAAGYRRERSARCRGYSACRS